MKKILSVVLATRNEEENIGACLKSVTKYLLTPLHKDYEGQSEIVVFDETSEDKTRDIAREYGAIVTKVQHEENFHITKQKAIEQTKGDWILQLDADERVSIRLGKEILNTINFDNKKRRREFEEKKKQYSKKWRLFERHEELIRKREGDLGKETGEIVAYFLPRVNFFLGGALIHAGVYPDGVIRLFKKGQAKLPAKNVHELMKVDGEVGWLFNDLEHHESPTLKRYISRMNRYTDLHANELNKKQVAKNVVNLWIYTCWKPEVTFLKLYIRHKGFMDGVRGFLWSLLSAMHYPISYYKFFVKHININER